MTAPKAFLSHATEDKQRFAMPFAVALRTKGIEVWVDQWEIKAGDSLVKKVFTDGIDDASIFIVVLSPVSVTKPWVSEELDAAVIRKIAGSCKIIPVVLDGAEVPAPLKHLLWVSESRHGFDGVVSEVVRSVFNLETKPPLGAPPAYMSVNHLATLAPNRVDNVVLNAIVDHHLDPLLGRLNNETMAEKVAPYDVSPEVLNESVSILAERGDIKLQRLSGGAWFVMGVPDHTLLSSLQARGVDVGGIEKRLLASLVNNPGQRISGFEDADPELVFALMRSFEAQGLVKGTKILGGPVVVHSVSAAASRVFASYEHIYVLPPSQVAGLSQTKAIRPRLPHVPHHHRPE